VQLDQLVAEILARGDIDDETTIELNRMLAEWRAGTLSADDTDYVRALHARLIGVTVEPGEAPAPTAATRLDGLTIEEWRDRALRAEAQVAQFEETGRDG
jgi:hypothetical protein